MLKICLKIIVQICFSSSKRFHPYEDFSSSEVSPRVHSSSLGFSSKYQRQSRISPFTHVPRRQGDGSETPDSEEVCLFF